MFGIKCKVNGKTFRGQDFERFYCRRCAYWRQERIKIVNLADGEAEITINCPSLVLVETYHPKRDTHVERSKLPKLGQPYELIYRFSGDPILNQERSRYYRIPEPQPETETDQAEREAADEESEKASEYFREHGSNY